MIEGRILSQLSNRLAAGEALVIAWCGLRDAVSAEIMANEGFDAALFDMQHGLLDIDTASAGIVSLAASGKPAIVRIPVAEFAMASRLLDAGASAIVAPMINNVAEARTLVSFTKYPPIGARSWGPYRAVPMSGMNGSTFLLNANAMQLTIAMVETREAMDSLDAILSIDGIDGVLVGPGDLSVALSEGKSVDSMPVEVAQALAEVSRAAKRHGKLACAFCPDGKSARELIKGGFQIVSAGTDRGMLRTATRLAIKEAKMP